MAQCRLRRLRGVDPFVLIPAEWARRRGSSYGASAMSTTPRNCDGGLGWIRTPRREPLGLSPSRAAAGEYTEPPNSDGSLPWLRTPYREPLNVGWTSASEGVTNKAGPAGASEWHMWEPLATPGDKPLRAAMREWGRPLTGR